MIPRVFVVDTNVLAAGLNTQDVRRPAARIINHMQAGAQRVRIDPEPLRGAKRAFDTPHAVDERGLDAAADGLVEGLIAVAAALRRDRDHRARDRRDHAGDAASAHPVSADHRRPGRGTQAL